MIPCLPAAPHSESHPLEGEESRARRRQNHQVKDRYVAQLAAADVPATGEVRWERDKGMGGTLIDMAKSHQAGLIVVGTRSRSNVKSMLLGSVSRAVLQHATIAVLVAPEVARCPARTLDRSEERRVGKECSS